MDTPCNNEALNAALAALLKEKILFKHHEFYQLKHDDSLVTERFKANKLAEKHLAKARKIAVFLNWFPFVKGIAVSGSLSKKVAGNKSDYDFFIITAYNHLWICRFLLSLLMKFAALLNLKKYFCINYMVDESYLEVEEKNIFTATEIATLMPLHGAKVFTAFFTANKWIYTYFPNMEFIETDIQDRRKNIFTRLAEWLLHNKAGAKADNMLMHYFEKRWIKMMDKNEHNESGFLLGSMMVDKHYCRPCPHHYQQKILSLHREKIQKLITHLSIAHRA